MSDTATSHQGAPQAAAKKSSRTQLLLLVLCGALLVIFGVWLLISPKQDYSPEENRTLASAPTFSLDALLDGSYTADLAEFCADQFPLRSMFVELKANCELLLMRGENNGVLKGKDGYLIVRQEYTDAQYDILRSNLTAANTFANAFEDLGIPVTVAIAPRSVDVNQSKLPSLYSSAGADAVWQIAAQAAGDLDPLVLTDTLKQAANAGEQVWYKTDHHWTTDGAYLAYVALSERLGYTPYPKSDFTPTVVTEEFYGTTYSTAGIRSVGADSISLYRFDGDTEFCTEVISNETVSTTLEGFYDLSALQTADEYNVFLGGTNAHIRITLSDDLRAEDKQARPTLVVIKDSFAQSLAPFLARHYDLVLIDPRSFPYQRTLIASLIREIAPEQILVLCGIDTLATGEHLPILNYGLSSAK